MKITIRDALVSDSARMAELDDLCFGDQFRYSDDLFEELVSHPNTICLIAQTEKGPAEMIGLAIADSTFGRVNFGHLVTIDVHPDLRRRSIGSMLLEQITLRLKKKGLKKILLEVYTQNSSAIRFYKTRGYEVVTTLENYYGTGRDGYLMLKDLNIKKPDGR